MPCLFLWYKAKVYIGYYQHSKKNDVFLRFRNVIIDRFSLLFCCVCSFLYLIKSGQSLLKSTSVWVIVVLYWSNDKRHVEQLVPLKTNGQIFLFDYNSCIPTYNWIGDCMSNSHSLDFIIHKLYNQPCLRYWKKFKKCFSWNWE